MQKRNAAFAATVGLAAGVSSAASAGLVGTTASVNYDQPALGQVLSSGGSALVVAGGTSFSLGGGLIQVDVTDTNILITFIGTWSFDTGTKSFDGVVLTDDEVNITNASVDLSNTSIRYLPAFLSFDSHNVEINFPSPPFTSLGGSETVSVNVTASPVPEPSTWSIMLLGFAALGYAGVRRARSARSAGAAA